MMKGINHLSQPASSPFSAALSLYQVVELIKTRQSHDDKAVQLMRTQFRTNKVELRIPRLPHPTHALQTQQALASGSQAPPAPAAPHIAPLPEGFALDPPAPSQLHQPASARGQAPKRPAPDVKIQNHKPKPSRTPIENVRIREVQHKTKQRHETVSPVRPYCPQQLHSGKLHVNPDHSLSTTHKTKVSR